MNCILGRDKFNSLEILLYSGARFSVVLCIHMQKLWKKHTAPVTWKTQGGELFKKVRYKL